MSDGTPPILRRVSWKDLFPGLILFRVPGVAVDVGSILLGTIAAWLVPLGWSLAATLFLAGEMPDRATVSPHGPSALVSPEWERLPSERPFPTFGLAGWTGQEPFSWSAPWNVFRAGPMRLIEPVLHTVRNGLDLRGTAYLSFGLLWTFAVMGVFGGAIARRAVVRFGTEQRVGLVESLRYALRRLGAMFAAPILPLLAAIPFLLVLTLLGTVSGTGWGATAVGGGFSLIALLVGFPLTILLLGVALGWPLMIPRVMANDTDSFGAVSAAYAYLYGRPWRVLIYSVVASVLGWIALALFQAFAEIVVGLTAWGTSLPLESNRLRDLSDGSGPFQTASRVLAWNVRLLGSLVEGYGIALFWTAASAIYLLLRLDVDHEEFDHIGFDEETRVLDPAHPERPAAPGGAAAAKPSPAAPGTAASGPASPGPTAPSDTAPPDA